MQVQDTEAIHTEEKRSGRKRHARRWGSVHGEMKGDTETADGMAAHGEKVSSLTAQELRKNGIDPRQLTASELKDAEIACSVDRTLIEDHKGGSFRDKLEVSVDETGKHKEASHEGGDTQECDGEENTHKWTKACSRKCRHESHVKAEQERRENKAKWAAQHRENTN